MTHFVVAMFNFQALLLKKKFVLYFLCFIYKPRCIRIFRHLQGNGIQMLEAMAFYGLSSLILL
jgi:hypothetical protein